MQYFGFDRPSFAFKAYGFGSSEFSPLDLFAGGKQGAWYDPSDKSTLFQDVTGAVPVTKDGDPVGLILDKSQGLEREILSLNFVNASASQFAFETVTSIPDGLSLVGEEVSAIVTDTPVNTNKGDIYEISFSIKNLSRSNISNIQVRLASGNNGSAGVLSTQSTYITENGDYKFLLRANYDTSNMYFSLYSGGNISYDVTNATFKKIKGNHASQPLAASRPTYRTDGNLHWLQFDGVDDYLEVKPFAAAMQQPYSFMAGVQRMYAGGSRSLVDSSVVATRFAIIDLASTNYIHAGITVTNTLPSNTGDKHVLTVFASGVDSKMQSGKGDIVTANIGNNPINNILIATRDKSTGFSINNLYGMLFVKGAIVEQGQVQDYLASKSGVTL